MAFYFTLNKLFLFLFTFSSQTPGKSGQVDYLLKPDMTFFKMK